MKFGFVKKILNKYIKAAELKQKDNCRKQQTVQNKFIFEKSYPQQ